MFRKGVSMEESVILGIDPGLANTGWGVVRAGGSRVRPVAYGCITTGVEDELPTRLATIHDMLCGIIDRYEPTALSAEGIYFGANAKSAMLTAQARGAALVACAYKGLEYGEYTPMQIKQALVGTGTAEKEQVQYMVKAVLGLDHEPKPDHAADALAAAITHARLCPVQRLQRQLAQREQAAQQPGGAPTARQARSKFDQRVQQALAREQARGVAR